MSFRELRNLTEMMRALGYPRPISMENFRLPNFALVSDLLDWMVKMYDPSASVTDAIDTEDDRVAFMTHVASTVLATAQIRLNPRKLYAADGCAVKELLKLARVLYQAFRMDGVTTPEPDDNDNDSDNDASVKALLSSRVHELKATRQLASDLTHAGAKLYDLLHAEGSVGQVRQHAMKFLEAWSTTPDESKEQLELDRRVQDLISTLHDNVVLTERQARALEAEEGALGAKITKSRTDLERSTVRLESLQHVRPAFLTEYETLETELRRQYAIYCERFRNLAYLHHEVEWHERWERQTVAAHDRSLKRLHKKFRDEELALLRGGPQDDNQVQLSRLEATDTLKRQRTQLIMARHTTPSSEATSGHSEANESEEDCSSRSGSSEVGDSSDASGDRRPEDCEATDGSSGHPVSLADSGELLDHDEDSGSGSEARSDSELSGSGATSDSDQDF